MKPLLAVAALAVVLVPAARAWMVVATVGEETAVGAVTRAGTELVAWPSVDGVVASRNGGPARVVASRPGAGLQPGPFLQFRDSRVALYLSSAGALGYRLDSRDDGRTWSIARVRTPSGAMVGAAVARPGGLPLFAGVVPSLVSDDLWYPVVWQGDRALEAAWRGPAGSYADVTVDSRNRAYVVYWRDAGPTFSLRLDADGAPAGTPRVLTRRGSLVGLVRGTAAIRRGDTLRFVNLRTHGVVRRTPPRFAGFGLLRPQADARGRLWVVWQDGDLLSAARAARVGAPFGRRIRVTIPHALPMWNVTSVVPLPHADGTLAVYAVVDGRLLRQRLTVTRR